MLANILSSVESIASASDLFLPVFKLFDSEYRRSLSKSPYPLLHDLTGISGNYLNLFDTAVSIEQLEHLILDKPNDPSLSPSVYQVSNYSLGLIPFFKSQLDLLQDREIVSAHNILSSIYFSIFNEYCSRFEQPPSYVSLKLVFGSQFAAPFLNLSTENKVIHIQRDPRSILLSRNSGKYLQAVKLKYPIRTIGTLWNNDAIISSVLQRRFPHQFLSIRYEDLVQNPYLTIHTILSFIGVSPLTLEHASLSNIVEKSFSYNNSSFNATSFSFLKSDDYFSYYKDYYREKLAENDLIAIENICFFSMLMSQYPFFAQHLNHDPFSKIDACTNPQQYQEWTLKYLSETYPFHERYSALIESAK